MPRPRVIRSVAPFLDPRELAPATPGERLVLLGSGESGLTAREAARRLGRYGLNEPVLPTASHPLRAFVGQFTHTLALLLWFAGGLAFAAGIPELGGAIVAVVGINGCFAFVQEYRSEQVVSSLMRRVAVQARAVRDGQGTLLPANHLVPGDVVQLAAGDIVPADCVLIESHNLTFDLSMLTGETRPVVRSEAPARVPSGTLHIGDIACLAPAGAGVSTGRGTAVVWATGPLSSIGVVASLVLGVGKKPSILERQVATLSRVTAAIAVLSGAATLGLASLLNETSFLPALTFATGVLVALVPEGLLPTLSVSLAIGARRMAERGAFVRRLSAVEVVGAVTVICCDKTGTLTENSLIVGGVTLPDGSANASPETLLTAVLASDAATEGDGGNLVGDPLDVALWQWAVSSGLDPEAARQGHPRIAEVPFEAHTRYMSVTCRTGESRAVFVKGAPEAVLKLAGDGELPPALEAAMNEATDRGDRVLLLASGAEGGPLAFNGLVRFVDPPRRGVPEAIASARLAGIRVVMLTGDHPATALAVARTVGLADGDLRVVEGPAVDAMSDGALRELLARNAVIARVDPEQKLRIVRALQAVGEIVVMTGDGVNDAPALRAADVGVAMGIRGTEVAKQAADIVLADDNFATIVAAIEEGRSIRANIRRFISYVFTSNVAEMTPFLLYLFLPVPLALAVIQALAIDVGTDLLPALGLGAERPSPGLMLERPEPPSRPLLTRAIGLRTFLFFGVLEAALGLAGFFAFYLVEGWRFGDSFAPFDAIARDATTVTFLAIVGGQVGCLFAERDGTFRQRLSLRSNGWVAAGLAFEVLLALLLIYTPGLNRLFSMAAVDPRWLLALPVAAVA
ncbi:MAG: cation-transporting P-type ATPase, partial [Anaerolineaceae bacterium]